MKRNLITRQVSEDEETKLALSDEECSEIIKELWHSGKQPVAKISADWHSAGGRIGQYGHMIQYGKSKPRKFDMWDLQSRLRGYDFIVKVKTEGTYGWTGDWISGKTIYSTDLDSIEDYCSYRSGATIEIWKIPANVLKRIRKNNAEKRLRPLAKVRK